MHKRRSAVRGGRTGTAPAKLAGPAPMDRTDVLGICLLLGTALLLRLPHLNDSLWFDEIWYTHVGLHGESLRYVLFHDTHPPFFALILWGWIAVFGDSEIAVRVPSLLCGLGSIVVTVALARRWFGRRVALMTGMLLALAPAHIWYSRENKNNMLLLLLTVTAVWALDRAWRSDQRRDWGLFLGAAALSLWTNVFAFWIACAMCLWLWLQALQSGRLNGVRCATIASVVLGAAFLPVALWDAYQFESLQLTTYLRPLTLAEVYRLLLIYLAHGNTLRTISPYAPLHALLQQAPALFLIDAFFAGLLLSGLASIIGQRRTAPPAMDATGRSLILFYFIVPLVIVWLASQIYAPIYIERSMLIVLPPYVMLLAVGAHALPHRAVRVLALAGLLVLNGWAVFNLSIAKADVWTVYKPKNDWRSVAHYLGGEIRDDAAPLMLFATAPASVLVYYDARFTEVFETDEAARPGARALINYVRHGARSIVERLQRQHADGGYLIEDPNWDNGFQKLLVAVKGDPDLRVFGMRSFQGVNVFQIGRTPEGH